MEIQIIDAFAAYRHVLICSLFFLGVCWILSPKQSGDKSHSRNPFSLALDSIYGLEYLVRGPSVLLRAYDKARGKAFQICTPSNRHLMVTSDAQIREVTSAPLGTLSLHAVAKEILQPKWTMHGFEWKDQRGLEGTGFVRALRSRLTAHLPSLMPELRSNIEDSLEQEIGLEFDADGYSSCSIFPMIKRVVTSANCVIFFGRELSRNDEFKAAALEFPQVVIFAAELLRISPSFAKPLVAILATRRHRAARTLMSHLRPIVQARMDARFERDGEAKSVDCMQWLIETSPMKNPWSVERMVGEIMALWFGSVHQLAMTTTFTLHDFCRYPEWVTRLRAELEEATAQSTPVPVDPESLPLLDGFSQESMRLSTSDAISCRRKALAPFQFDDGLQVNPGDWVCIPQQAMMQDEQIWPQPSEFNPDRFLHGENHLHSRLTDISNKWPVWGLSNAACPGRFYASLAMKLILIHILQNYDCELPTEGSRVRTWRSSIVPRGTTIMKFQRRRTEVAASG